MFATYDWRVMITPKEFGPRLKAMRERREITLESIADSTKIGLPLLQALERSDLSHWPKGIFRRAFFRDYAAAIGAPVEDMLQEFSRLFPDHGPAVTDGRLPTALRMTLATVPPRIRPRTMRIIAVFADAAVVVLLGLAAAWGLALEWSIGVAAACCLYYPLTTMWLGRSPALLLAAGKRGSESRPADWAGAHDTRARHEPCRLRRGSRGLAGGGLPARTPHGSRSPLRRPPGSRTGRRAHRKRVRHAQGLRGMNPHFYADERLSG